MQNKYPQKPGIDFILKQAFFYWNKTLLYQLVFSIIYFAVFFTAFFFLASRYGIWDMNQELAEAFKVSTTEYMKKIAEVSATESYQSFTYGILATLIFLYPLNLGFFQIFRKMDLNEKLELGDIFAGYKGLNFFKYIGFYIFWMFTYLLVAQTIILAVVWVVVTVFAAPLMFYTGKGTFEAIALSFKALKMFFVEIVVCVMVAFFFKYIGFALFLVGGLFTFPFWNAMIYSLYKTAFSEKN